MQKEFTYLEDFINHIDVICPKCKSRSLVISDSENRNNTSFSCFKCGHSKKWKGNSSISYSGIWDDIGGILMGQPVDCYFKIPLWYTSEVKTQVLFAYNLDHLNFLEEYISGKLRERSANEHGWSNRSLDSRLPKWMLNAKNRSILIRKIKELKIKM